jgi:hypothetical protein
MSKQLNLTLLLQPNAWSCLPTAFAMVLQTTPAAIFEYLEHDGSEIIWPDKPEPLRRRSFHIQEMFDFCIAQYVYPVAIEALPCIYPGEVCEDEKEILEIERVVDIEQYLVRRPGVLVGEYEGNRHAVAWDGELVFDPTGYKYQINEFGLETFYALY